MADSQKFCLKWDGFHSNVTSVFDNLRLDEELVDITLCCDGARIGAHRIMLSACSPYFRDVLKNNPCQHLVFFIKDTSAPDLHALVEFMYRGSVNVAQNRLASFIKTAEMLQIRGLSGEDDKSLSQPPKPPAPPQPTPAPSSQRRSSVHASASNASTYNPTAQRRPVSPLSSSPAVKRQRVMGSSGDVDADEAAGRMQLPAAAVGSVCSPEDGGSFQSMPSPISAMSQQPTSVPPLSSSMLGIGADDGGGLPMSSNAMHLPPPHDNHHQSVKVEKVDLTEDDEVEGDDGTGEDVGLDATLGQVAEYEGYDGSDNSMLAGGDMQAQIQSMVAAGNFSGDPGAGPSQFGTGEEGSAQGHVCELCGCRYAQAESLTAHRAVHVGRTQCPLCGSIPSTVAHLRRHLASVHGLSVPEIHAIVPTKTRNQFKAIITPQPSSALNK